MKIVHHDSSGSMAMFRQAVDEVLSLAAQKKIIPPRPVEELGRAVEIEERDFHETLAELRRLWLVKRMVKKAKI